MPKSRGFKPGGYDNPLYGRPLRQPTGPTIKDHLSRPRPSWDQVKELMTKSGGSGSGKLAEWEENMNYYHKKLLERDREEMLKEKKKKKKKRKKEKKEKHAKKGKHKKEKRKKRKHSSDSSSAPDSSSSSANSSDFDSDSNSDSSKKIRKTNHSQDQDQELQLSSLGLNKNDLELIRKKTGERAKKDEPVKLSEFMKYDHPDEDTESANEPNKTEDRKRKWDDPHGPKKSGSRWDDDRAH